MGDNEKFVSILVVFSNRHEQLLSSEHLYLRLWVAPRRLNKVAYKCKLRIIIFQFAFPIVVIFMPLLTDHLQQTHFRVVPFGVKNSFWVVKQIEYAVYLFRLVACAKRLNPPRIPLVVKLFSVFVYVQHNLVEGLLYLKGSPPGRMSVGDNI